MNLLLWGAFAIWKLLLLRQEYTGHTESKRQDFRHPVVAWSHVARTNGAGWRILRPARRVDNAGRRGGRMTCFGG